MKIRGVNIPGREKKLCEAMKPEQGWPDQGTVGKPWASSEDDRGTRKGQRGVELLRSYKIILQSE